MTDLKKVDLVIAGAGMTGLALALSASDLGLSVVVVDPKVKMPKGFDRFIKSQLKLNFDSRVSALTQSSKDLLSQIGVWNQIAQWGAEGYTQMHVWDSETRGEISFDAKEVHQPLLGHITENRWISFALLQKAVSDSGIEFRLGAKIDRLSPSESNSRTVVLSSGEQLQTDLLVCADGAESETRKMAGLGTHEWDYGQDAVVATLRSENSHRHACWQCFTADGPLALLPLPDPESRAVSLVWSTSPEHAAELKAMDNSQFCKAITEGSQSVLGRLNSASGVQSIRLRQRHAQSYVTDQVALIGDAAHTIHPLAGQGVNLGFMDVIALTEELQRAITRREAIGDLRVLKRYQRARQIENVKMGALMEGFKRLFSAQPPILELGRSLGMRWVDRSGPLKQHLIQQAMGLSRRG